MITRRNFIQMFGLTAVAGLSFNLADQAFGQMAQVDDLFQIPGESMSDPVYLFTSNHFKPLIETDFQIRQEGSRRADLVRLIEVKEHQSKTNLQKGVQGDSFSLMFYNSRGLKITRSQFEFNHEVLGKFSLLITPVSLEPNYYEAIINHLRRSEAD